MSPKISPGEYFTGYKVKRANNFLLTATKESEKVIKEADILYSQNQLDDLYEFLKQYEDVESGQICWRLARYGQRLTTDTMFVIEYRFYSSTSKFKDMDIYHT